MEDFTKIYAGSGSAPSGKNEWVFWFLGAALAVAALALSFYGISSLTQKLNIAFNPSLIKLAETVKFNLDKIKGLGI